MRNNDKQGIQNHEFSDERIIQSANVGVWKLRATLKSVRESLKVWDVYADIIELIHSCGLADDVEYVLDLATVPPHVAATYKHTLPELLAKDLNNAQRDVLLARLRDLSTEIGRVRSEHLTNAQQPQTTHGSVRTGQYHCPDALNDWDVR